MLKPKSVGEIKQLHWLPEFERREEEGLAGLIAIDEFCYTVPRRQWEGLVQDYYLDKII